MAPSLTMQKDRTMGMRCFLFMVRQEHGSYGGDRIVGAVLEDPPVFSTESDYFEQSFAYQDTYKLMHEKISLALERIFC